MMNSRYSKFLTILLVIVIVAIIGLLGFWAYQVYQKYNINNDAEQAVEEFQHASGGKTDNTIDNATNPYNSVQSADSNQDNSGVKTYKGFVMAGTIEIPKTGCKYPILAEANKKTIEVAVAILYGPGLNRPGNTVIVGHNYRNGMFFSNNKKITNGDKIYITDLEGKRMTYTIYNKFETDDTDTEYMTRDTQGAVEISLTTCTDDSKARLIILAKADV